MGRMISIRAAVLVLFLEFVFAVIDRLSFLNRWCCCCLMEESDNVGEGATSRWRRGDC